MESFRKYKLLIPALILLALSFWTVANAGSDYSIDFHHYSAMFASLLCVISFFTFRKAYKYILGATLLFGLPNLLNFTPSLSTINLCSHGHCLNFQPLSFFLIILTLILAIPKKSEMTEMRSEAARQVMQKQFNDDFDKFKTLYERKSSADLQELIADQKYTPAAKEAAKHILEQRENENREI